ncbi:rhomboid family protein [Venturia nashicola]|nr:rhomboid family protein [Venturia nashicola]
MNNVYAIAIKAPSQTRWYAPGSDTTHSKSHARPGPKIKNEISPATNERKPTENQETEIGYEEFQPPSTVELSADQIVAIFGPGTPFDLGMQILQELQMRRVSGELQDKGIDLSELDVTEVQAMAGLNYLRDNFPVDEEAAAKEWQQLEIERLTKAIEDRAERVGLYKKKEVEYEEEEEPEERRPKQVTNVYGESVLVQRQKEMKAKEEAEEKAKKEEAEKIGQPVESYRGQQMVLAKQQQIDVRRQEKRKRAEEYAKAAEIPKEAILAERPAYSRLFFPTLFSLAVIVASLLFAEAYEPPTSSMRMFPLVSPAMASCMGIALVNMVVFILWRRPELWSLFNKNMMMSAGHPIAFSMLGSIFSHQTVRHIFTNGLILFLAGPTVCEEIGRGNFIAIFLVSGLGANLISLWYNVLIKNYLMASLGMSGAVYGLVAAYLLIADRRRIGSEIWGVNYPGWIVFVPLLLTEIVSWKKMPRLGPQSIGGTSDHANHVGGMVSGAILGLWLKWRKAEQEKAWHEYDAAVLPVSEVETEASATPVNVVKKVV